MTNAIAEIVTRRCRIAPLRREDAAALQAITDASVTSSIDFLPDPFTLADAQALIAGVSDSHCFYAIWDLAGAELRGVIGVDMRGEREIEIGYWLAADARGKGLAREAVRAMIAELASRHPERRIVAECHPDNARSWSLLERVGFISTGKTGARPGRLLLAWAPEGNYRFDVC